MRIMVPGAVLLSILAMGFSQVGCQGEKVTGGGSNPTTLVQSGLLRANDVKYMHRLAHANGGSMRLDLSDPSQHRFLLARLAASGKTRGNSPKFFEMIEGMKQRHTSAKEGTPTPLTTIPPRDHLVADVTGINNTPTLALQATTFATIENGADYNFVDAVVWDESGTQQLSDYGWGEEYGDGRHLIAQANGTVDSPPAEMQVQVDSLNLISVNGVEESYYTLVTTPAGKPTGELNHPKDLKNGDNIVHICLTTPHATCDYPVFSGNSIKVPVKGHITLPGPVTKIYTESDITYAKLSGTAGGTAKGETQVPFGGSVKVDPLNNRRIVWDVPALGFPTKPFLPDSKVDFILNIKVQFQRLSKLTDTTAIMSSIKSSDGMPPVTPLKFTWDCLAKGTKIQLSSGETASIEDIGQGMLLKSDASGRTLPVSDISIGLEAPPMVHITDSVGHDLLLSKTHPIMTPDKGAVLAEELTVGSKVLTDKGVSTLVRVIQEKYSGKVYNLQLDRGQSKGASAGSTLYANGFLVGDLAMQKAYELKDHNALQADVLSRLPKAWHTDYRNSVKVTSR